MSNHFPAIPGDLAVSQIMYFATGQNAEISSSSPFYFASGVQSVGGPLNPQGNIGQWNFSFTTPGEYGTFDQDTVEAAIARVITDLAQSGVDNYGVPLADIQATISVSRTYFFTSPSNMNNWPGLYYNDTMTYPPAA